MTPTDVLRNRRYQYDGAHHVTQKTDAKGNQVRYTYDPYGRLSHVDKYAMINGVLTEQTNQMVRYHYDSNDLDSGFYQNNLLGRLAYVQMSDPNTQGRVFYYEYSYTGAGRVGNQRLKVIGDMTVNGFGATTNLDLGYTYDQEGRLIESGTPAGGPHYRYTYDNMGRAAGLWEDNQSQPSATATYGVAGEIQQLTYWAVTENRQYNTMFQLTNQTATALGSTVLNMTYNYTAGQNNGRITSGVDGVLGETVNYGYDALNRLSSATATNGAWGQAFAYDGFGNLTDKTVTVGSAPTLHVTFDPATNRQTGVNYDENGNPTDGKVYDVENRLVSVPGYQSYQYDYRGKRITKLMGSTTELYLYGVDGRKVATYQCSDVSSYQQFTCGSPTFDTYWNGKLVKNKGQEVTTDRLGSVRWSRTVGWSAFYPYGEERAGTDDNREKFGTYMRDNAVQDYADQRYYGPGTGRFFTPDPAGISAAISTEGNTWNRYAYSHGDPMNIWDPGGLRGTTVGVGGDDEGEEDDSDHGGFGFGTACLVNGKLYPESYCSIFAGYGVVIGDGQTSIGVGGTRGPRSDAIMQYELEQALRNAGEILNSNADCAALFGGGDQQVGIAPKATTILAQIDNSFTFGEITAPKGTVTSATTKGTGNTSPWGADVIYSSVEIKLNNTSMGASFVDGNLNDWTTTVLHELGHAAYDLYGPQASKITPDTGNTALSEANTRLIRERCRL
jgi:RHS repeat-associated protein